MRLKKGVNLTAAQMQLYTAITRDMIQERIRQIRKFGAQTATPLVPPDTLRATLFVGTEQQCKDACDTAFDRGHGSWAHIIAEEVAEAVEAGTDAERRIELIQLAACCLGAIEALDTQRAARAVEAVEDE